MTEDRLLHLPNSGQWVHPGTGEIETPLAILSILDGGAGGIPAQLVVLPPREPGGAVVLCVDYGPASGYSYLEIPAADVSQLVSALEAGMA